MQYRNYWQKKAPEAMAARFPKDAELSNIDGYTPAWLPCCISFSGDGRLGQAVYLSQDLYEELDEKKLILTSLEMIAYLQAAYGDGGNLNELPVNLDFTGPVFSLRGDLNSDEYTAENAAVYTHVNSYEEFIAVSLSGYPHYIPQKLDALDTIRYACWNAYARVRYARNFAMPWDMADVKKRLEEVWHYATIQDGSGMSVAEELLSHILEEIDNNAEWIYNYDSKFLRDGFVQAYM